MPNFLSKLLSAGADKDLKEYQRITAHVNELEPRFSAMDDEELSGQTKLFRERIENGEALDDLLPEAFAAVREASRRTTGMRHFDVQIIGGIALHRGTIAEMKTGEGKTLVSTLAGYLNALEGKGVHIVTVNDYLAKRDSEWMGQIYRFMGLSVGLLQNGMRLNLKKPAYQADVTYGTNSEFGFDYLRDNMVTRPSLRVQRGHHYAIVDEVDSILIDEARTPLIISGAGTKSAGTYKDFARAVRGLTPDVDFEMDEAKHTIAATDEGLKKIERNLGIDDIYADPSGQLVNHLQQALKAQYMFHRDQQYVVVDGEVKIVDEFTGRIMEGRRYSEGLHQAIEAKEGVLVREENQTLATITLQNYFLMYDKLSGMTGTAMTEDAEFREVYHVPVQVIPPNKPVIRVDHEDLVYKTVAAKFNAVADDVAERHAKGQPCLVGTVSIENSERLSRILDKRGIKHNVLNAKYHEREAQIVAQAGREGAVTIATNMAGRGTDILLGGNPKAMAEDMLREQGFYAPAKEDEEPVLPTEEERAAALEKAKAICEREREHVVAAGGLAVIGTERHESRRIDNQLRGRAGRQGDPGASRFYLSLEDDLMRLFGGDRVSSLMDTLKLDEDTPIENRMITNTLESAQKKLEGRNFEIRKNVLKYDDVMNQQREIIYGQRRKVLDGEDISTEMHNMLRENIDSSCSQFLAGDVKDDWDFGALRRHYQGWLTTDADFRYTVADFDNISREGIADMLYNRGMQILQAKEVRYGAPLMRELERICLLKCVDRQWMDHIDNMDQLRQGIALRGYGQKDPVVEYRIEGFDMFDQMVDSIREDSVKMLLTIEIRQAGAAPKREQVAKPTGEGFVPGNGAPGVKGTPKGQPVRVIKIGRNDPCPCGSGLKWKKCTCAKFHPEGLPTDANED